MRFFSKKLLPILFLLLIFTITTIEADNDSDNDAISSSAASDTIINLNNDNNELNLEDEVMLETIATGRGDRDEVGEREEWSSTEHLRESSRVDTKKGRPISSHIKKKLQSYRIECKGCDHYEAVAKINAFILDAKRHAEDQAQRQKILSVVVQIIVGVALCVLVCFFYYDITTNKGSTYTLGGGGGGSDDKRRLQIEDQRRRVAARQEQEKKILVSQRANAPTWVDNEMMEVWSPKQEKQFANALVMYGRMAPKTRYSLIADNVDDKTKQECLMHHKLQQLIAKEQ